jgi:hypothetical protein
LLVLYFFLLSLVKKKKISQAKCFAKNKYFIKQGESFVLKNKKNFLFEKEAFCLKNTSLGENTSLSGRLPSGAFFKDLKNNSNLTPYKSFKKALLLIDKVFLKKKLYYLSQNFKFPTDQLVLTKTKKSLEKTILECLSPVSKTKNSSPKVFQSENDLFFLSQMITKRKSFSYPSDTLKIGALNQEPFKLYNTIFFGLKNSLDLILDSKINQDYIEKNRISLSSLKDTHLLNFETFYKNYDFSWRQTFHPQKNSPLFSNHIDFYLRLANPGAYELSRSKNKKFCLEQIKNNIDKKIVNKFIVFSREKANNHVGRANVNFKNGSLASKIILPKLPLFLSNATFWKPSRSESPQKKESDSIRAKMMFIFKATPYQKKEHRENLSLEAKVLKLNHSIRGGNLKERLKTFKEKTPPILNDLRERPFIPGSADGGPASRSAPLKQRLSSKKTERIFSQLNLSSTNNNTYIKATPYQKNSWDEVISVSEFKEKKNNYMISSYKQESSFIKKEKGNKLNTVTSFKNSFLSLSNYINLITKNIKTILNPYKHRLTYLPEINLKASGCIKNFDAAGSMPKTLKTFASGPLCPAPGKPFMEGHGAGGFFKNENPSAGKPYIVKNKSLINKLSYFDPEKSNLKNFFIKPTPFKTFDLKKKNITKKGLRDVSKSNFPSKSEKIFLSFLSKAKKAYSTNGLNVLKKNSEITFSKQNIIQTEKKSNLATVKFLSRYPFIKFKSRLKLMQATLPSFKSKLDKNGFIILNSNSPFLPYNASEVKNTKSILGFLRGRTAGRLYPYKEESK